MLIRVKVFPESKEEKIIQKSEDKFEVWVKARPVHGQANEAVVNVLLKYLKVSKSDLRLIRGARTRNKIFEVNKPELQRNLGF